jgi:hypothetical protein
MVDGEEIDFATHELRITADDIAKSRSNRE